MKLLLLSLAFCLHALASFSQQTLSPVASDSRVNFEIKNFGFGVEGSLEGMKGSIVFDPANISNSKFDVTVDVATINTDNSRRDNHLKTADFFDATKFPVIRIASTSIERTEKSFMFVGNLTIKGVTEKIIFPFNACLLYTSPSPRD